MNQPADRSGTALLVVDVQNGVVDPSINRDQVVAKVVALVDQARAASVPVVWVMHNDPDELPRDQPDWQLSPELQVRANEAVVHKNYGDSFEATDLDAVLAAADVGHVVVAGAQSEFCITSTLHGAVARGYGATLVTDAHTTEDLTEWGAPPPEVVVANTNRVWSAHEVAGRPSAAVLAADVRFAD